VAAAPDAWLEMDEAAEKLCEANADNTPHDAIRYSVVRLHGGSAGRIVLGLVLREPAAKRTWLADLQRWMHRSAMIPTT
jgi:hypothetical protein